MTETLERAESLTPGSNEINETAVAEQRTRWSRTHTIWLLMVLSLIPGVVVAMFREEWAALPAGVRGAAYIASGILITTACCLIVMGGQKRSSS